MLPFMGHFCIEIKCRFACTLEMHIKRNERQFSLNSRLNRNKKGCEKNYPVSVSLCLSTGFCEVDAI